MKMYIIETDRQTDRPAHTTMIELIYESVEIHYACVGPGSTQIGNSVGINTVLVSIRVLHFVALDLVMFHIM